MRDERRKAIEEFYKRHKGWNLLANSPRCPYCGKPNYCKRHKYAYLEYWVGYWIAMTK